MISPTGPTIWPAMINPCDDIPPNTNQCTVIMDDDGDPFTWPIHIANTNNAKKQWRAKLAKIGQVREMLIRDICSLSCVLLLTKILNQEQTTELQTQERPPENNFLKLGDAKTKIQHLKRLPDYSNFWLSETPSPLEVNAWGIKRYFQGVFPSQARELHRERGRERLQLQIIHGSRLRGVKQIANY